VTEKDENQRFLSKISIDRLIDILKSWKGSRPDYDNPDFSRWHQTEVEYQKEQRQWLKSRKGKKAAKKKRRK
jgi:hypothetical protein